MILKLANELLVKTYSENQFAVNFKIFHVIFFFIFCSFFHSFKLDF